MAKGSWLRAAIGDQRRRFQYYHRGVASGSCEDGVQNRVASHVAPELWLDIQGGQDKQVSAPLQAGRREHVRPARGEHLRNVGQLLVHCVQGVEEVDVPGVGDDRETGVPDMDAVSRHSPTVR